MSLTVGIVGAGAIGTLFGASLDPATDVRVFARDDAARAIARRGGLTLDGAPPRRVVIGSDPSLLDGADLLVVAVKTYATQTALAPLRGRRDAPRVVVGVQNGLDAVRRFDAALGDDVAIALAPTTEGVAACGPGAARRTGRGATRIGWAAGRAGASDILEAFVAALARLDVALASPIEPYVWAKLVANAAINPLTALARVPNGALLDDPSLRERAARIAREAAAVAARTGVALPFADPVAHVEAIARATASNRSSMLVDLDAGRESEIEAIVGALVAEARRVDVAVPESARTLAEVRSRVRARSDDEDRRELADVTKPDALVERDRGCVEVVDVERERRHLEE